MARPEPTYDLMLMLDSNADEARRVQILADVEALIDATGEIVGRADWGMRKMAFEIRHKPEADYHLLQFRAGTEVLERLQRTLRITDGVLRFRLIRLPTGAEPLGFEAAAAPDVA